MTVARYIALSLISRFHCLDPTNRDISRVHCTWVPQSLAQMLPDLTSFWPMGKSIWANGQVTMTLHNYRSRQVHETLNGINPSSSFRDMRSTKSGPNLWQIWQVFGTWASPYAANGQITMTVHNYRPRQFHRTSNGENPSSGYRDMGSASMAAARPPGCPNARPPRPWRQYPSRLRGKNYISMIKNIPGGTKLLLSLMLSYHQLHLIHITNILQNIYLDALSWMNTIIFFIKCHWKLFLGKEDVAVNLGVQ